MHFAKKSLEPQSKNRDEFWHILIVDDDKEVHKVTEFALDELEIDGLPIKFYSAFSEDEAKEKFKDIEDLAVVLLDVVIDREDSGFSMIRYLRDELKNNTTRIIIRTGQPGVAPEDEVILKYDINDYTKKTDLTQSRLMVSVVAAIRSYRDIKKISSFNLLLKEEVEEKTKELEELNENLHKRVKEEIERAKNSESLLLQRSKMADMGELFRVITHQIRQPITAISLLCEVLRSDIEDEKPQEKLFGSIDKISNQCYFMSNTITNFKEFLRPSRGKREFDIVESIKFIADILKPLYIFEKIDLEVKNLTQKDKLTIYGYDSELKHVFLNILNNAIDAIVGHNATLRYISIKIYTKDDFLYVDIEDSGGGIAEENFSKIFEQNFSTKEDKGTGIGLYLAKKVVENHLDGAISVKNGDNGALFSISLPLSCKSQ